MRIDIPLLTCQRCGWQWVPRAEHVRACPNCHSILWDLPPHILRRPKHEPGTAASD